MNSAELKDLAERTRFMREVGIAILLASGILATTILITSMFTKPISPKHIAGAVPTVPDSFSKVQIDAKAAIVYDLATGETLYAKNPEAQLPLASLTKLLTVYAAVRNLSQNTLITIPAEATQVEAPHALKAGQTFTLADLARITLTASLNDGAAAIAKIVAAQEDVSEHALLAGAAAALDLSQTYALNGSGLDESATMSGGYGSASDLARLAGAVVEQAPAIARATTEAKVTARSEQGAALTVKNTDPMVASIPRLLLSKTGYTDLAGGNLALVFDAGIMHPISIIVLGSSKNARFTDGTALVAATIAHFAGVSSL